MSLTFQHIESITFNNKLTTNFACNSSEDGRISLITENGVIIYTLMNYLDNIFPDMAFRKKIVQVPEFSLSEEIGVDFQALYDKIRQENLYETVLRIDLTCQLNYSTPMEAKPIAVGWSPKGLIGHSHCALTVLSNIHGLSIFMRYLDETSVEHYECVANVTQCIVNQEAQNWPDITSLNYAIQIEELTRRTETTRHTAFVWSHCTSTPQETFAILFVSHPKGSISSWKFSRRKEHDIELRPLIFSGKFQSSLGHISSLYWKQTSKNGGALSYGDIKGRVAVVTVSNLHQTSLKFEDEVKFLDEMDLVAVKHITSFEYNGNTFLVIVREGFLVTFAIDSNGSVLDEMTMDFGNLLITGISHYKDNVLLVLTLGKLTKVTLKLENSRLKIEDELVPLKFDNTKLKTHGLILSENRIFLGILAFPCRLTDITRDPRPASFFFYHDTSISPFQFILKNTDESLEKYWDCFEILRLISYRDKIFPWQGIDKDLNYDTLTISQLKSLRWVAKLSQNVYNVIPSITEYNIKPYILIHNMVTIKLVIQRMKKLFNLLDSGKELTTFQMRSLDIQNMFLKEMVLTKIPEKAKMGENFVDEMIEVMEIANELEYPDMPLCFWCNEKIIGPTCIPPHADSRCSISMMQIFLKPGFKCPFCKCVAHSKIKEETNIVTCPYCDIPMDQIHCEERNANCGSELKDKWKFLLDDEIPENLRIDEFDEPEGDAEDFEDNQISFVALSDSEEEEEEEGMMEEERNFMQHKFFETMRNAAGSSNQENLGEFSGNLRENENSDYSFDDDSDEEDDKSSKKVE